MQISLNGIKTQMLTISMGIKRTHLEYQDHIKVKKLRCQDVMGRWHNGVPMYRLNYGGDYYSGVGSKNGDVRTMQYFSYPVSVSRNRIIMYYV